MSYKRLNSYKGKLSPAQISEGMNLARRNAIHLLEDARQKVEAWRQDYNKNRPPGALRNLSPLVYTATMAKSV